MADEGLTDSPWAYALDGYAIYGPNATSDEDFSTSPLDEYNGHSPNGVYHYHANDGTGGRPYVLGGFVGDVSYHLSDNGIIINKGSESDLMGETESPRNPNDSTCFEDEPISSAITLTYDGDLYTLSTASPYTLDSSQLVQHTKYRINDSISSQSFDFYYYDGSLAIISGCTTEGLTRSSSTSTETTSLLVLDQTYRISTGTDYVKWVQQGTDNELGARQDNGTWGADDTNMTYWTLVTALDSDATQYSIQSVYDSSYYIHGAVNDKAYVYSLSSSYSVSEFSLSVEDASTTTNFSSYTGYVIYYTVSGTNYYMVPYENPNKDYSFNTIDQINSLGISYSKAVFTYYQQ